MGFSHFLKALAGRVRRALSSRETRTSKPAGNRAAKKNGATSSMEFRDTHRGFSIRVSAARHGAYSIAVEDQRGVEPALLRALLAAAGCARTRKFARLEEAIDATAAAKRAIDSYLAAESR